MIKNSGRKKVDIKERYRPAMKKGRKVGGDLKKKGLHWESEGGRGGRTSVKQGRNCLIMTFWLI